MKQPLLSVAVVYAAGILLPEFIRFPPLLLLATGLGLAVVSLVSARARPLLLWPLILLTGAANLALHTAVISPQDLRNLLASEPQIATVRGRLRETPQLRIYAHGEQESWRTMAQVEVTAIRLNKQQEWRPAFGRMAITTRGTLTNLFVGQVVEVSGVARLPKLPDAPGTFDYRRYLSELGIYYQLQAESENDWRLVSSPARPPLPDRFRNWARKALALGLPAEDESLRLEWALTLGWKTALTEEVSEPFIQAATYHIFAVDGLRMAIIFGIFLVAFRVAGMPRVACGLVLFPVIWMYTALTGWPASAIRASVMLSVIMGGWMLKRPSDMLNSLFAAAILILVWAPQQLFQAGFQLSFCVVLCIILIVPGLNRILERLIAGNPLRPPQLRPKLPEWIGVPLRYVVDLLIISFAAWVGSLPLVAYYFHVLTSVSTPANVIAVPLCALVLIANFSTFLFAGWFPAAAGLLNHAGWFLMECIRVTSHWFANWPRAYFYVPAPSLFTSCLYYALLLAVATGWLFQQRLRAWKLAGAGVALLVWGCAAWNEHDTLRLTILPLSGGCATYFDGPGTKPDLLVDCGADKSVDSITKPFLRAQGVNRLPGMVLTHGDVRHVGGAREVAGLFGLERAYASPVRFRSAIYRQIIERFSRPPPILQTISRRDSVGNWTVLHPERDDHFAQADDNALVLLGNLGGTRVLLLSDLGRPGQTALLERAPDLRADIVVSGLPAQTEALGDPLLDAIRPRLIIVVDSDYPVTERAGVKLRDRLGKRGVPVIYTREAGAVTLEFLGRKWELRTISGMKVRSRDRG